MVFDIDDGYIFDLPAGSHVRLEIEYLYEGMDWFDVQYDAHSGRPYKDGTFMSTDGIHNTNNGEFKTALFILDDARLANGNYSADFRIADMGDGAEIIRRATVTVLP